MKRILILAGAAVLLVLAVVLVLRDRGEGGARSAVVDTPAAAPTPAATAPRTEARRTPPTVEASGASTTATPSGSPDARAAPATADAPTVPWLAPVPWEQIPLDSAMGETLGDFTSRKEFSKVMVTPRVMGECDSRWTRPAGLKELDMKVELRVQAQGDGLVVEDAKVIDANVADADLVACVEGSYRGRRINVPPASQNARYRIRWGIQKSYE